MTVQPQEGVPTPEQAKALQYALSGAAATPAQFHRQVLDRCKLLGWLRPDGHIQMPAGREALRRHNTTLGLDLFRRPLA